VTQSDTITEGSRVICEGIGPHDGARGRVKDAFAGQLVVEMSETTIIEPRTYFKKV